MCHPVCLPLGFGPWALGPWPWALGPGPWVMGLWAWGLGLGPQALGLGLALVLHEFCSSRKNRDKCDFRYLILESQETLLN